jgi:cytochrome c peroxidase
MRNCRQSTGFPLVMAALVLGTATWAAADGWLKDPLQPSTLGRTIAQDLLDGAGKMQCTSCHDIHSSGVGTHMLRGYNYGRETIENEDGTTSQVRHGPQLCRMCHLK